MKKAIIVVSNEYEENVSAMNNKQRIEWYNEHSDEVAFMSLDIESFVTHVNLFGISADEYIFTLEYEDFDVEIPAFNKAIDSCFAQYDEFLTDFRGCVSFEEFCKKMENNNLYTFDSNFDYNEVYYRGIKIEIDDKNYMRSVSYLGYDGEPMLLSSKMFERVGCDALTVYINEEKKRRENLDFFETSQVEPIKIESLDNMVEIPISQEAESEATPETEEVETPDRLVFDEEDIANLFPELKKGEDAVMMFTINGIQYYLYLMADRPYDQFGFFLYDSDYHKLYGNWLCGIIEETMFVDIANELPISGKVEIPTYVSPRIFAQMIK